MVTQLAIDAFESRSSLEAAVRRWIERLDRARPLTSCSLTVRREPTHRRRVRIDLAVTCEDAEVTITSAVKLREPTELYALIADAFRDAYHRI